MNKFKPDQSIHDIINEAYLSNLPIGKGTGSIDDPIIMLPDIDYVHNEYEVLGFLGYYRKIEWLSVSQRLLHTDGKYIDSLTISISEISDSLANSRNETYYFDVTLCFENAIQFDENDSFVM
jgi:hypothetical protein